jgi:flagellar protein FliL
MTDEPQDPDDGEDGAENEEEGAAKKGKRKLIIIAAAALVVVLGGGAAAYFLLFSGGGEEDTTEVIAAVQTYFYDLPVMTVNLADTGTGGNEQFLKLTVSLELENEAMVEALAPRVTLVMDAFQVYLRELRRSDLQGSAGIYRLKDELRRRVNLAIYPAQVQSVLFKEILVQ